MADQRNLTFGLQFSMEKPIGQIDNLFQKLDEVKQGMIWIEQESDEMGSRTKAGAQAAEDGLAEAGTQAVKFKEQIRDGAQKAQEELEKTSRQAERAGENIGKSAVRAGNDYREIGKGAESMAAAVVTSADTAMKKTNSFGTTVKAGVNGLVGYAEKRIGGFEKSVTANMKKMVTFVKNPIQTIKDGLAGALNKARQSLEDTGDEADKTRDKLGDVGKTGEDAGTNIKDALESAAGKLVALKAGFEIIKKGVEITKNLASSIFEAGKNADALKAKFSAVFSDDSGVGQWSENFAKGINRSKSEVQDFLVSNKAMYSELGITGEAANSLSKITTSLAYDIGAAFKMDDAEALSVLQDYINGNTSALAGYGVQIDEAVLKHSALQMGIKKNIDEMSDAEAAQVRMNALLENSSVIQQKAADAELGYANGSKAITAKLQDLKEEIGTKFEPVFSKVVGKLLEAWPEIEPKVMSFFDTIQSGLSVAGPALIDMAVTALPQVIDTFTKMVEAGAPIGGVLLGLANTALPPLLDALGPVVSVIGDLAGTVLPPLGSIIGKLAQTVIPPFVDVVTLISEKAVKPLVPLIEKVADAILPVLESGMQALLPLLDAVLPILEPISTVIGKIVEGLGKVASYAASGIGTVINKVSGLFGGGRGKSSDDMPHNAFGTQNFKGGWTHINEQGGEIAYLPGGSKIIPADKSQQIISNTAQKGARDIKLSIPIEIKVDGNADRKQLEEMKQELIKTLMDKVPEIVKKAIDEEDARIAILEGYA